MSIYRAVAIHPTKKIMNASSCAFLQHWMVGFLTQTLAYVTQLSNFCRYEKNLGIIRQYDRQLCVRGIALGKTTDDSRDEHTF